MSLRFLGIDPKPFRHLFGLKDAALARLGIERHRVTASPGTPDRISLRDLQPGQTALLMHYVHQPADTPYRASHAIFVGEADGEAACYVDTLPPALALRPLSLRAFSRGHRMLDADLVTADAALDSAARLLARPDVAYLHAHYARPGCFAARVERA
ncbi:DUF1203 domain-containing protein [Pseudomarimonas salicorniae]|uniref:DUF1203 domain-containing protein n=1 Tax=Pseudomarimonas salicorniae TaxID=2933270 RepID=A0ABT0GIW5_9GAMM|nr:DUF1203 domain-containing protein [Lysobacter sp. CAU 1642]MCK7594504.1 DUF1203 domain-containing protein [Lysobacter sp. CAU 1642]